jgi:hypothetical protein
LPSAGFAGPATRRTSVLVDHLKISAKKSFIACHERLSAFSLYFAPGFEKPGLGWVKA